MDCHSIPFRESLKNNLITTFTRASRRALQVFFKKKSKPKTKQKKNQKNPTTTNYRFSFPWSNLSLLPPLSACRDKKKPPWFLSLQLSSIDNTTICYLFGQKNTWFWKAALFCPSFAAGRFPDPILEVIPRKSTAPWQKTFIFCRWLFLAKTHHAKECSTGTASAAFSSWEHIEQKRCFGDRAGGIGASLLPLFRSRRSGATAFPTTALGASTPPWAAQVNPLLTPPTGIKSLLQKDVLNHQKGWNTKE